MKKFNAKNLVKELNKEYQDQKISFEILEEGVGKEVDAAPVDYDIREDYVVALKISGNEKERRYALIECDDIDSVSDFVDDEFYLIN